MYLTRFAPPFVDLRLRRGERPGSKGADPETGAPPSPAPRRRSWAGTGRMHLLARLPGRTGVLARTHLGGEG
jgi:hypothetical protein